MASQAQIAANRRNAKKSTGPKTPEGKTAVRFNAITHGLSARVFLANKDDSPALQDLSERLLTSWPDEHQRFLLEDMAVTQVELARVRKIAIWLESRYKFWGDEEKVTSLDRLFRIISRLQRHYFKCAEELGRLQSGPQPLKKMTKQTQFDDPLPVPPPAPTSKHADDELPTAGELFREIFRRDYDDPDDSSPQ